MSVLEYGKLIIALISVTTGLQASITLITIFGFLVGYCSAALIFWAFKKLQQYEDTHK